MRAEVLAMWPEAASADFDLADRWMRFTTHDGRIVYLQRYAWDDTMRPDYLVVSHRGTGPAEQRRYGTLAEAVEAVRRTLVGKRIRPAA